MKVAITDACIFIDLCQLQLITLFFNLELEVHTTIDVLNELWDEHQELLKGYRATGRLTIHIARDTDKTAIASVNYPRALSESDCSVLYFAAINKAIVLSSDKLVRNTAKRLAIPYHGMLWVFDQLVAAGLLPPQAAAAKLQELINTNIVFQNNRELVAEMQKRLKEWL